ncbi:pyridine nucleotide-disulfide oxidoreductase [Leifsonia sp. Root227]|uniref:FAD-dependent oxidoreductase n=1 Tax=Leifsonia sp. Root227 TaxID=1736496 RepID=UPI0007016916|nr:FAD-dependent oxidoreductase [Leifsonia sp. Root227]KRC47305.1 pyridine nucleotide-disulfide oxidoreductase [Leifsonia sp. Root227]
MQQQTVTSDVTVIGGGLAGVAAAIAAARAGATVALINNRPVLGGNSSSEIRVWVCGATAHGAQKYARETGIMGELYLENQYRNPEGNPYFWDQVVLDAVRAETGITLFLNTDVTAVNADGDDDDRRIIDVTGWQQGSERRLTFAGPVFIDASGDGLVGELAGAWYASGREAASVYQEEWAPEVPDGNMLGSTLFFYTKDLGEPVRYVPPSIAKDIAETSILVHRRIDTSANGCDYWWIEWGGELDAVADNERIRDELWAVVYGIWDHIKNSGRFDAETLTLEWVGSVPGKREYRRFLGDHVLTQSDIMDQTRFDDRIGFGGWSIDLHPPGGMYSTDHGSKHLFTSGVYHIPFRSLYSRNTRNLLMAGRDISASHVAFGTTRVMATCAVTGEAAGAGAALAALQGITPRRVATERMAELQQLLLRSDASLLGVPWTSEDDRAFAADITASSTLTTLRVEEAPDAVPYALDEHDFGLHLPVDPVLDSVGILVEAAGPTEVTVELWSTEGGENHIPVRFVDRRTLHVEAGRSMVGADFGYAPTTPEDVVVVIRRAPGLSVIVNAGAAPSGVLGLLSRTPATDLNRPQSNAWSAAELRRHSPVFEAAPATLAYEPEHAVGGYARPYGGPNLWSSERIASGREESLELRWPGPIGAGRIEVIFNDEVDEDLVNLHHHRTPFAVIPELVRDYRIEAATADGWVTLDVVAGNRRRRRVHDLGGVTTDAVRLVVEATNGSAWASVVAVRVFE